MTPEIINFINSQKVCVLAVEMPDGSPHAATVHFALAEGPVGAGGHRTFRWPRLGPCGCQFTPTAASRQGGEAHG